ncbi:hypothetical protein ACFV6B_32940 [Streptomyces microflavus]
METIDPLPPEAFVKAQQPTCTEDYRSAPCDTTHQSNCAYTDPTTEQ